MGQCVMAGCKESQFYSLLFGQLSPKKIFDEQVLLQFFCYLNSPKKLPLTHWAS